MTDTNKLKKLTVVIPAFNEEQSIGQVLKDINSVCSEIVQEIIVVDDGSTDDTARVAKNAGARLLRHEENIGYGAALKTGIRSAQTEFVLTMDSDGQHRAEDILQLWEFAEANDMVVGQRTGLKHSPLWRMPGKCFLGLMANYLIRKKIPDLNSGLRVIKRDIALKYLHLCPSGFSFSTTFTMALLSRTYRVKYVPIKVVSRSGKSAVSVSTGLDTIILILRIASLFNPLRIFIPLSLLIFTAGLSYGFYYLHEGYGISGAPLFLLISSILVFAVGLLSDQISQLRLERFE